MTVPPPAVLMDGVVRRFGAVEALRGLTWSARSGEVTCVLGPNGAGKTTGVEIAVGLRRPDAGTVRVLGADPWGAGAAHRARVGVMLQDGGLPQSVRPVALLQHLARFWERPADVPALVRRLGIEDFARTTVRRLSGGQRQRVAWRVPSWAVPRWPSSTSRRPGWTRTRVVRCTRSSPRRRPAAARPW
ncbi:ATP-binding cassette domain-containing protein [Ornithinimicrobium sp. CNJ-824]|uniref:ATP-binding cassette domain-containing protein n=1 Tax=Ornithinimicrobium sp. CNJ-824 TaxID=1904966 RepID=UPI0026AF33B1